MSGPLRARWEQLPPTDRRALAWLGAFVLAVLAWLAVWQPALGRLQAARDDVVRERELHAYLEATAGPVAGGARVAAGQVTVAQLREVAASTAGAEGLVVAGIQEQPDGVELRFTDAPVARLAAWIATLEARGIRPQAVELPAIHAGRSEARVRLLAP